MSEVASPPPGSKRVMNSVIPGVTVAETRAVLQQIRQLHSQHSTNAPHIGCVEINGLTVERFAFLFVHGRHQRRHAANRD